MEFAKFHKSEFPNIPLVCVPSSFNEITAKELADAGFDDTAYGGTAQDDRDYGDVDSYNGDDYDVGWTGGVPP